MQSSGDCEPGDDQISMVIDYLHRHHLLSAGFDGEPAQNDSNTRSCQSPFFESDSHGRGSFRRWDFFDFGATPVKQPARHWVTPFHPCVNSIADGAGAASGAGERRTRVVPARGPDATRATAAARE